MNVITVSLFTATLLNVIECEMEGALAKAAQMIQRVPELNNYNDGANVGTFGIF